MGPREARCRRAHFCHFQRLSTCYTHGGDVATIGMDKDVKWMRAGNGKYYEPKTEALRPDKEDRQQVRVPNRILTRTKDGANYEAYPRHAGIVTGEFGLKDAKGVVMPGATEGGSTNHDHET